MSTCAAEPPIREGFLSRVQSLFPSRESLSTMRRSPRNDVLAGVAVAIVALPLALGFGVASGLGATAGLTTAILAGALAAIFGGSNLQVSGPTGAMTVVLVPIVHRYGTSGVLTVGLLAGVLMLGLALARIGRYMAYVPAPLVEGFTLGIAAVIALQQVPTALGVKAPAGENTVVVAVKAIGRFAAHPHPYAIALAAGVMVMMFAGGRFRPAFPFSLLAVALATGATQIWHLPVTRIGQLPTVLGAPSVSFFDVSAVPALAMSAVAVAALASLESLMSATVADAMSVNERHDSNRELFGQGVANMLVPLFGGVAATGAIARTAVNVRAGAVSRLAALVHAVVLLVIVLVASALVAFVPLAALAGVLIATALRMVEAGSLRALARAGRGELAIMVLTTATTLAFNLVTAVLTGLVAAGAVALVKVAKAARLDQVALHADIPAADHHAEEQRLLGEHIIAYRIDGPLFFGAAHRFLLELQQIADIKAVIMRMSRVSTIDATGALVLKDAIDHLRARGIRVMVSGIQTGHMKVLDATGALQALKDENLVFATTPEAIAAARVHLRSDGAIGYPRAVDAP